MGPTVESLEFRIWREIADVKRRLAPQFHARLKIRLEAPTNIAPPSGACVNQYAVWKRMDNH